MIAIAAAYLAGIATLPIGYFLVVVVRRWRRSKSAAARNPYPAFKSRRT